MHGSHRIVVGDVLHQLATLPDESVLLARAVAAHVRATILA